VPEGPRRTRRPCPDCGSVGRAFGVHIEGQLTLKEGFGLKRKRPGLKRPVFEEVNKPEVYLRSGATTTAVGSSRRAGAGAGLRHAHAVFVAQYRFALDFLDRLDRDPGFDALLDHYYIPTRYRTASREGSPPRRSRRAT